jgi:uncharacterized protein
MRWFIRLNFHIQEEFSMSPKSFRLMQYHQHVDAQLRAEINRRWPDMLRIQKLKKLKLKVKDQLASIVGINQQSLRDSHS